MYISFLFFLCILYIFEFVFHSYYLMTCFQFLKTPALVWMFVFPLDSHTEILNVMVLGGEAFGRCWSHYGRASMMGLVPPAFFFFFFFNFLFYIGIQLGFPGGLEGKEYACNAVDMGLIPGFGKSPGEGNGNPLQYSCLENPRDRGAWRTTVHGVAKSFIWMSN